MKKSILGILALSCITLLFVGCSANVMKSTPLYTGSYNVGYTKEGKIVKATDKRAVRVQRMTEESLPPADFNVWPFAMSRPPTMSIFWPLYESNDVGWALRPFVYRDDLDSERIYTFAWLTGAALYPQETYNWFAPLYLSHTNETDSVSKLYTLLGGYSTTPTQSKGFIFPLFYSKTDNVDTASIFYTLLGGYSSSPTSSSGCILPLLYFYEKDKYKTEHSYMLMGRTESSDSKYATGFLPLFFYEKNRYSALPSTSWWAPVGLAGFDGNDSEYDTWVLPFFIREKYNHFTRNHFLLSMVGNSYYDQQLKGFWAHPFFLHTEDKSDSMCNTQLCLFGLAGRDADHESTLNWAFPLYTYEKGNGTNEGYTSLSTLMGLFGHEVDSKKQETTSWGLPLYTYSVSPHEKLYTFILGLGGYNTWKESTTHWAAPLYLYSQGEGKKQGNKTFTTLLGLGGYDVDSLHQETTAWAFPFFTYFASPEETLQTYMMGLGGKAGTDTEHTTWALPFLLRTKDSDLVRNHFLLSMFGNSFYKDKLSGMWCHPFWMSTQDYVDSNQNTQLSFLAMWGRDEDENEILNWLFPAYFHSKSKKDDHETLITAVGLGGYTGDEKNNTTWALPFLYRENMNRATRNNFLLGLCGNSFFDSQLSGYWCHPFYLHTEDYLNSEYTTDLALFGMWGRDESATSIDHWLVPIYYHTRDKLENTAHWLSLLAWGSTQENGDYSYNSIIPIVSGEKKGKRSSHWLLGPLAGWTADEGEGLDFSWFSPLYYLDREGFITAICGYMPDFEYYATPLFSTVKIPGIRQSWLPFPLFNMNIVNPDSYPESSCFGIDGLFACQSNIQIREERKNSSYGIFGLGYHSHTQDDTVDTNYIPVFKDSDQPCYETGTSILGVTKYKEVRNSSLTEGWNILLFFNTQTQYFSNNMTQLVYDKEAENFDPELIPVIDIDTKHSTVLFPFYFSDYTQKMDKQKSYGSYTIFPFYSADYTQNGEYDEASLFWFYTQAAEKYYALPNSLNIQKQLFWHLFYSENSIYNQDSKAYSHIDRDIFFGLYNYMYNPEFTKNRLLFFFRDMDYANGNQEQLSLFYQYWKDIDQTTKKVNIDERLLGGFVYSHQSVISDGEDGEVESASTRIFRELYRYKKNKDGSKNLVSFPFINWDRSADEKSSRFGFMYRMFRHVETEEETDAVDILFIPVYRKSWFN